MTEQTPQFEIDLDLPEHLDGPVQLPNGELVNIGDWIEHPDCGVGKVYRIATYHDHLGILLCVEFPGNVHEMIGLRFVKKVQNK